ncbi:DUF1972 domain-containing protein [Desulfosediminicola flagellatus]|uniref:DUF1972 domain-containing protein n=1 Tax=Desulfosediminicola flagellatus TaxID=2569541 RepID=UPI0010AD3F58|nr:DUF1972 domain-containing protein [Desulfosediminicola flagellatus]
MKEDKKIAIIGTVGIPAKYGGFETLTEYLTKHLGSSLDLTVFCSSKSYNEKHHNHNNAKLIYIDFDANGVQSIVYDIVSMFKALRFADTLLILGVSGCIALPVIRCISKKKIVVNIDGLEWKRAKWNRLAKWFLKFSEKLAVQYSDQVIIDNKAIQDYVNQEYGVESTLIEYGGDHVGKLPLGQEMKEAYPLSQQPYAFTVCRIEPENNIHTILEAFSQVSFPLLMVGNFGNSVYGKSLVKKFSGIQNIQLCDPIYDQGKLDQLRGNAALYVHGHSAGGTNPSLVEAMCLGLPIAAFDVGYNRETTVNQAVYFTTPGDLIDIVNNGQEQFDEIRVAMKKIAMSRYSWRKITQQYADILTGS